MSWHCIMFQQGAPANYVNGGHYRHDFVSTLYPVLPEHGYPILSLCRFSTREKKRANAGTGECIAASKNKRLNICY